MPFDDLSGDADDGSFGAPLPPEDRLWRHPSEMKAGPLPSGNRSDITPLAGAAVSPPSATGQQGGVRGGAWAMVAVGTISGLVASMLTVGVLAARGMLDHTIERVVEAPLPPATRYLEPISTSGSGQSPEVATIARRIEPSLARVEVQTPMGVVSGTAVAVRSEGFYLTSADLLERRSDVALVLSGGNRVPATVLGIDQVTNLAVLRATSSPAVVPTFGSSTQLVAGADAVVIGAAERSARSPSVAKGVVNAVGVRYLLNNGTTLHDLIRTDANMVPGTKGGVLTDSNGAVVGVITTIGKDDAGAERIGFAMPIEYAKAMADNFLLFGRPAPVWLGIGCVTLPRNDAEARGIPGGVLVQTVVPQSPAQLVGVAPGDIVVAIDNAPIDTWSAMNLALRKLSPGYPLTLTLLRGEQTIQALTYVVRPPETITDIPVQ